MIFFRENMGQESYSMATEQFRAFPVQLEGRDPALAPAFPSVAVRRHLAGAFQQSTRLKTHSRAPSCLRLSFVMYTNIFLNQMLVHN